jgi:hypothetical protein
MVRFFLAALAAFLMLLRAALLCFGVAMVCTLFLSLPAHREDPIDSDVLKQTDKRGGSLQYAKECMGPVG